MGIDNCLGGGHGSGGSGHGLGACGAFMVICDVVHNDGGGAWVTLVLGLGMLCTDRAGARFGVMPWLSLASINQSKSW